MNKEHRNLLIVGAGIAAVVAYGFLRKGRTLKNLNFGFKGIDIDKKNRVVSVDLRIINPTKTTINVNSIVADIMLQGEAIGTLRYLKDISINGQSEIIVRIPAVINPVGLVYLFTTLLTSKTKSIEFKIKGVVSAENILFPVEVTTNYNLDILRKQPA